MNLTKTLVDTYHPGNDDPIFLGNLTTNGSIEEQGKMELLRHSELQYFSNQCQFHAWMKMKSFQIIWMRKKRVWKNLKRKTVKLVSVSKLWSFYCAIFANRILKVAFWTFKLLWYDFFVVRSESFQMFKTLDKKKPSYLF